MLRTLTFALALAVTTPAFADTDVARPILKSTVVIADDLVHIDDLVDNAGAVGSVAIFRAPDLGTTGSVPTAQVLDAIRPYGLEAVDTAGVSAVTVTRTSRTITADEIKQHIRHALAGQRGLGAAADLRLTLDQTLRTIHIESLASGDLQVARLSYSPSAQRFDILMYVPGSALLRRSPLHLSGTVVETAEALVLARSLKRGELIRKSDLISERRPRAELGDDRIGRLDLAVGLAAQRALRAGQALKQSDLMKPELIQRNEMVTLVYEAPGITLTMRGKAIEPGSEGDAVSVVNLESKRTVQGTVTGFGRVTVTSRMAARTASLQPAHNRNQQPE
jgi:flagella basal body P-ring formation protein FlgA